VPEVGLSLSNKKSEKEVGGITDPARSSTVNVVVPLCTTT
jgi:hypothetical protein